MDETLPSTEPLDSASVRAAFPTLEDVTYLNVGTYGIMPEPALAQFLDAVAAFERGGVASKMNLGGKAEQTRERIAALLGASAKEIAYTRDATDGINLVLAGMDWKPGDEVITTDEEHEAMIHPLFYLAQTKGIRVHRIAVSPDADMMRERLETTVTPRTRLIGMSHVTCETGTRLPAREISAWAAERNILSLFDGAQALGALPVNVREIGCDFYTSNGHKWLCGPKGTGVFYGRIDKLTQLSPAHVGAGSLAWVDLNTGAVEAWASGQRFEYGTRAWGLYVGLGASLDWFEQLGWSNVVSHIETLGGYLKQQIQSVPWLKLLTPMDWNASSGLVTFQVSGHNAGQVSHGLREKAHIVVRVIPHFNAIRISTAHFNNTADIDELMTTLDAIRNG